MGGRIKRGLCWRGIVGDPKADVIGVSGASVHEDDISNKEVKKGMEEYKSPLCKRRESRGHNDI